MKMLPKDEILYRRIEEVVHYIWDPIGISEYPAARDEYHSYMTAIFGRVQKGELEGILEYMKWVYENMGLSFEKENATKAAQTMLEWKIYVEETYQN